MSMEWLLIPVFLLCALVMRIFVKLVDRFIADMIIPQDEVKDARNMVKHTASEAGHKSHRAKKTVPVPAEKSRKGSPVNGRAHNTAASTYARDGAALADNAQWTRGNTAEVFESAANNEENLAISTLTFSGLLDKFRERSNVGRDENANTIEIGTARPTQIRIKHYEQP